MRFNDKVCSINPLSITLRATGFFVRQKHPNNQLLFMLS